MLRSIVPAGERSPSRPWPRKTKPELIQGSRILLREERARFARALRSCKCLPQNATFHMQTRKAYQFNHQIELPKLRALASGQPQKRTCMQSTSLSCQLLCRF
jgi:hypothetical protein